MTKISTSSVYTSPLVVLRLFLLIGLLSYAANSFATIRYVRATQTGAGNGSNWDNASNNLQAIIDAAAIGDEVWVAGGTYQRANSGDYFTMKEGVKIYGGFAGDELILEDRDLANTANTSILKGNSYSVIKNDGNGLTNAAVLDGFTITGGMVGDADLGGGGIYNNNVSPILKNCSITGNRASDFGGGMRNNNSSPTLINCSITGNTNFSGNGGGMYNTDSAPKLISCSFADNYAEYGGSALFNNRSASVIMNCSFSNNSTNDGGGALMNYNSPSLTLTNCFFTGNSGGVMFNVNSSPTLTNCTIGNNTNSNDNSAVYNVSPSSLKLRNCIVYGNSGGIAGDGSTDIQYSLVQGITSTSNNNISGDVDPLFADAANGNYRLQQCSPVINQGSNTYYASGQTPDLSVITTDLVGEARFYNNGVVDMGAYEMEYISAIIYVKKGASGPGTSWDCASGDLQSAINSAAGGQQVWVAKGTYQRPNSGEYFRMKDNVKIYGGFNGDETSIAQRDLTITAHASVLQGNGTHVVYNNGNSIESSALLDGFTITGGSGDFGGGIRNFNASPTIKNCIIKNNTVNYHGAGMYNASASPTMINCIFSVNGATLLGGGVYNSAATPKFTNCSFSNNTAANGAGIFNTGSSTATVTNCTITGNIASNGTGGITNNSSTLILRNSIVYGNSSGINVGDIQYSLVQGMTGTDNHNISGDTNPLFVDAANGNYRLQACSPVINKGNNGYYAMAQDPDLSSIITDLDGKTRFYNNGAVDMGAYELEYSTAIIYVKEGATGPGTSWTCATGNLQAAIISAQSDNEVWVAGGNYQGSFTMKEGVKIYGGFKGDEISLALRDLRNTANASILTGGIYVIDNYENNLTADAVLDGFTITGGSKSGVRNRLTSPSIINCSIKGNSSGNSGEYGGGFFNDESSPTITNCSITGNRARFGGGGMANVNSSSPILTNCTISGNQAADNSGAIYNESSSSPVIRNSIIYGNTGGIRNYYSSPQIYYSLVQGVTTTDDDGNISGDTDPLFLDAANGDYRVKACSPVIDRGNKSYFSYGRDRGPDLSHIKTDLNGELRIYNGTVDIGAYEFAGTSTAPALAVNNDAFTGQISGNSLIGVNGSACTVIAYLVPNGGAPIAGEVTAKVWVEATQPGKFLKRHYQITPTTGAETATAKVTLYFSQQEFTDFNAANSTKLPIDAADVENYKLNLRIEKRSGDSDNNSGLPGSYNGAVKTINPLDPLVHGSITWNNWASRWEVSFDVTGFSGFFVKTSETPLPLKLVSFTGTTEKGVNLLTWQTADEKDFSHFEIEYSSNAKAFVSVGTVKGGQAGVYQFTHRPMSAPISYYRLRMVDTDGSFAYSRIVSWQGADTDVIAGNLFPNPAKGSNVLMDIAVAEAASWETGVYTLAGVRVKHAVTAMKSGANRLIIDIKGLPSGIYLVRLKNMQQEITRKLVVE